MAGTSRSQVTITLGRNGQVVKRPGQVLDNAFSSHSQEGGSKRSVRDRLGSNGDSSELSNKRLKLDDTRLNSSASNSVDDVCLRRDDLRFKIMQKNVLKQTQSNGNQNELDLRKILSRPTRPSMATMQQHLPDPRNGRHQQPEPNNIRQRFAEPEGVRQQMAEATGGSILGRLPLTRSAEALPQLVDLRSSSYSPWTLDRLRQRSVDGVLGTTSRGFLPPKNSEVLQRRPLVQTYDHVRTVPIPFIEKDVITVSRPIGSSSLMGKSALSAPHPQGSGVIHKTSYTVDGQYTVEGFLLSLGLDKYYVLFKSEEVDMTALRQMGENDLKELGIPMGPRKKILLALMSRSKQQV